MKETLLGPTEKLLEVTPEEQEKLRQAVERGPAGQHPATWRMIVALARDGWVVIERVALQ